MCIRDRACIVDVGDTGMSYVIPWSSIPKELQEPLHRYVSEAEGKLCGYCKEELCNSESGRMVVELYLGKQDGHGSRILYLSLIHIFWYPACGGAAGDRPCSLQ